MHWGKPLWAHLVPPQLVLCKCFAWKHKAAQWEDVVAEKHTRDVKLHLSVYVCADGRWRNYCSSMEWDVVFVSNKGLLPTGHSFWLRFHTAALSRCCSDVSNCTCGPFRVRFSSAEQNDTQKKGERKERGSGLRDGNCFGCMRSVWVRRSCRTVPSEGFKASVFWGFSAFNSLFWPTGGIYTLPLVTFHPA